MYGSAGKERLLEGARRSPRNSSRSEFDFINSLRRKALRRAGRIARSSFLPSSLILGIGDDAAVIEQRTGIDTVITADLLVEEVDFRLTTTRARWLGHKALAVSLSDIAAMGARPRWALLGMGVPSFLWRSGFPELFYEGFFELADLHGVTLIGGDVSRTPERVVIDSIVLGEVARHGAVFRSGARPGDHLFVTGELGGARLGLGLLERRMYRDAGPVERQAIEHAIRRQVLPEPRVSWGALLGRERLATAMIDISDGLSSDIAHLCSESGVGASLHEERIPIDHSARYLGGRLRLDPLEAALHGGEDFELLFTVSPRSVSRLPGRVGNVPATYIGDVTYERDGIRIGARSRNRRLKSGGFRHFS